MTMAMDASSKIGEKIEITDDIEQEILKIQDL
jgi:sRNA-binding carbon storage regulator CsrA